MAEMIDFGGWRKRRGQQIYDPKEGHPYVVALVDGELCYSATRTGDEPALLQTVQIMPAAGGDKQALLSAQGVCEQHWREQQTDEPAAAKLGVARVPLDWQQQTDPDVDGPPAQIWVATRPDGTTYTVEEDERDWLTDPPDTSRAYFVQVDGEDLGDPQPTLAAGQALCQWHADTELAWEANGPRYVALPYHCDPAPDGGWGAWLGDELIDDTADSSDEAQEACQEHHREQHPPPQAEPAEAARPDGKPARELGDWMIGRPPTVEVRAGLSLKQAEGSEEIQGLRIELDIAERASKATRKRIEKEIHEIELRMLELASEVRHGMSAKVRCWRERVNGEWLYTDEAGTELYREPAETPLPAGAQQKLVGDRTVPREPSPTAEPPPPPDDVPDGEMPDHAPPATEPHPEPEMGPAPPGEPLQWRTRKGAHGQEHCCGGEREGYVVSRDPGTQSIPGKPGMLKIRYYNLALGIEREWGNCVKVSEAKKEAQWDNDTRVRWSGDADSPLLVSHCGRYQVVDVGDGQRQLEYVEPGLDADAEVLGKPHDGLAAALLAAQADSERRRAEAGD